MWKIQHPFICIECKKKRYSNIKNRLVCQKCIVEKNKENKKEGEEKQIKLF